MISINQRAAVIVQQMIADADALGIQAHHLSNGAIVVDAGVKVPGSLAAGLKFSEACLGGLGQVSLTRLAYQDALAEPGGGFWLPAVSVSVTYPHIACMASQYAGWAISREKFFAMGSGPARALYAGEELFKKLDYKDQAEVAVLLHQTFMNLSGASVGSATKSLGVSPGDLIVIHDDIDLPLGTLRVRRGGGHGGHNGIRHIREVLGTGEFVRVKVGVGRPPAGGDVAAYVLSRFSARDRDCLDSVLMNSVEAVEWILLRGLQEAMNRFNGRETST